MAPGSASETDAMLQVIRRFKIINDPMYQTFYEALTRVSKMLTNS
jgi:four helix bundle protein